VPANPDVPALVAHVTAITAAQARLREAMAQVAAEVKSAPTPAPEQVKAP
jgi:hypothetical protein